MCNSGRCLRCAVDGQLLMKNREVLTLDEERILADAERYMNTL